jgi:hypothetical protein
VTSKRSPEAVNVGLPTEVVGMGAPRNRKYGCCEAQPASVVTTMKSEIAIRFMGPCSQLRD